jgi:hypothetical protein
LRNEPAFIKHKHFKPLPWRTFYRLTSTLLAFMSVRKSDGYLLIHYKNGVGSIPTGGNCQAGRYKRSNDSGRFI